MKQSELAGLASDRFLKAFYAVELTDKRAAVLESASIYDFDRSINSRHAPSEPDVPVTATSDPSDEFEVRDFRNSVHEISRHSRARRRYPCSNCRRDISSRS